MKELLNKFIKDIFNGKTIRLSEIENPKLTNDNFDNFETKLLQSAERQINAAVARISLSYLLNDTDGHYDTYYNSR